MTDSKWYTAVLVITSEIVGAEGEEPMVDLQYRILQATGPEAALARCLEIGRAGETSYPNESGETVKWRFLGVHELIELEGAPGDGAEVYSRLTREQPESLVTRQDDLQAFAVRKYEHLSAGELLERVQGIRPK